MRATAIIGGLLAAAATAVLVLGIFSGGEEGKPGFLEPGVLIADVNLVLQMNDILPERLHVAWWKNLMRLTLAGYWASALLGLGAYYTWYAG